VPVARALDHVVLIAADVEVTLDWYVSHLGLRPERVEGWRAGELPFPSVRLDDALILDIVAGAPDGAGHVDHLCFVVSRAELDEVKAAGELAIVAEGERSGARGMAHSIYVHDPDGLLVELRAYPGDR
jgi:catechol 2,3-dioxygenase-like lactoylglutathione lyase family enzyme